MDFEVHVIRLNSLANVWRIQLTLALKLGLTYHSAKYVLFVRIMPENWGYSECNPVSLPFLIQFGKFSLLHVHVHCIANLASVVSTVI